MYKITDESSVIFLFLINYSAIALSASCFSFSALKNNRKFADKLSDDGLLAVECGCRGCLHFLIKQKGPSLQLWNY